MKKLLLMFALAGTLAFSQTQVAPIVNPHIQLFNAGVPCSGCLLDTFAAGTTTPLVTYSESTGTTPNANPVVADASGFVTVYLTTSSYKLRLRTAGGVTLWTQDNVSWNNLASTLGSLTVTGNSVIKPAVAATSGANQSSPTLCIDSFYFNVTSLTDAWCLQAVLGTGTNPTTTFNVTHSGSSGTATFNIPGNETVGGTLGVTGASTLSSINNTCYANAQTGATADVKFNACIASLPSTGGVVDGTGLQGAQTIVAKVDASAKPVALKIGAATFTVSSSVGFDLGVSGSIVGLAPGPSPNDTFTTAVSVIKAGANNAVLVRSTGVGGGQVIRNLTLDGNKASFTGTVALQLTGAVDTQLENITVKNCSGEAVQLIAPIELHWTNGLVENNGTSAAIHASASGIGSGSGNLSLKNVTVRLNGGDGILLEGGGAGIKLDATNIDRNGGAGIRLQMQSVINAAPTGLTLDTVTLESNADTVGQLVVSGNTATLVSLNVLNPTCNGSNQLGTVAPTCFALDNVVFATFIGGSSFSGTNSFKITNSSNVVIHNFKNGNTNLYAGGSAAASASLIGGVLNLSNDSMLCRLGTNSFEIGDTGGTCDASGSLSMAHVIAGTDIKIGGGTVLTGQTGSGASIVTNTGPSITNAALTTPSLGGETITASPRTVYSAFYSSTLSATGTFARIIPDKAITVTRVNVTFFSNGSTCTVFPKIRVSDGSNNVDTTATASAFADSGAVSQNYAAGVNLDISLNAAQACTVGNFQNANVEVQYKMQ